MSSLDLESEVEHAKFGYFSVYRRPRSSRRENSLEKVMEGVYGSMHKMPSQNALASSLRVNILSSQW
jgi:hypothetical protein